MTILEMLGRIGADIGPTTRWVTIARLRALGVKMERNAKVEEITESGVRASRDSSSEFFQGHSVVLAVGMEPNQQLARELPAKVASLQVIGDSAEPGKISDAIESGFRVALTL